MKTVIADDEKSILEELKRNLDKIQELEVVGAFTDPFSALQFIMANEVDLMILDIEMSKITGIELADAVKKINKTVQVIFATGYSTYAMDAFRVDAISYLMKPYTFQELDEAVGKARVMLNGIKNKKSEADVVVQTFGKFEIFYRKKRIEFYSWKAKELLAILVDCQGGTVTMEYAVSRLWEDSSLNEKVKASYRKAVSKMRETLNKAGCGELVIYRRGQLAIRLEMLECDYYQVLEGDTQNATLFMGNYMEDYSWAEERNGLLTEHLRKNMLLNEK